MTLRTLMQAGPAKANELFARLSDTSDGAVKTREKLFAELKAALELHTSLEEQPILRRNAETKELIAEAIKDNKALRSKLAELEAMPKNDEAFPQGLKELQKAFRQHARDDKRELLSAVQRALTEDEVQSVAEKIEAGVAEAEQAKQDEVEARRANARQERADTEHQVEQQEATKRAQKSEADQVHQETAQAARGAAEQVGHTSAEALRQGNHAAAQTVQHSGEATAATMRQFGEVAERASRRGMQLLAEGQQKFVQSMAERLEQTGHEMAEAAQVAGENLRMLMVLPDVASGNLRELQQGMGSVFEGVIRTNLDAAQELMRLADFGAVVRLQQRAVHNYMDALLQGGVILTRSARTAADRTLGTLEQQLEYRQHGRAEGPRHERRSGCVGDVMHRDPRLANPDDTVQQVAQLMRDEDTGVLPVCEGDSLVGIVTDRDVALRLVADGRDPARTKVREVMTPEGRYVFEDEDLNTVAANMAKQQVRRLPVLNRTKRLVGIVSLSDLTRDGRQPELAGQALGGIARRGGRHTQNAAH